MTTTRQPCRLCQQAEHLERVGEDVYCPSCRHVFRISPSGEVTCWETQHVPKSPRGWRVTTARA